MTGQVQQKIYDKLSAAFAPASLEVKDESHLHAGHAGARPEGETHFRVKIVSEAFRGKPLVQRHRMVNETLADELAGPVHALAIKASPPET
ncbi:MAG: BolA family protein [Pseudomonadota bacterium]